MNRRELLQLLGASAALPFLPTTAAALDGLHARAAEQTRFRTLSRSQQRILTRLVDEIIPRTATPGAVDVHVPALIDLLLTEWYDADQTAKFVANLDAIDDAAKSSAGGAFVALNPRAMRAFLRNLESQKGVSTGAPKAFRDIKGLTVWGYFTSERVSKEVLKERMFFPSYDGNAPFEVQR